jgi:glucose-1-phosphate adenylyltransferase
VCSDLRRIHVLPQYHGQSLNRHRTERWNFLSSELGEYIDLVPPKMRGAGGYYRGTADAIYRNLELLDTHRPDIVLILSGDHVYRADYRRFIETHLEREADITVLTDWVDAQLCTAFGVLTLDPDGRITGFVEKPADPTPYAYGGRCSTNLGVYCFDTEFLVQQLVRDAKKNTSHDFGRNILPSCVDDARVLSCPLEVVSPDPTPYWRDVGSIDSYFQTSMDLLSVPSPFKLTDSRWTPDSRFHEWVPALSSATAKIGGKSVHGRNILSSAVSVEDAQVIQSVLSPRVRVERGCEIEESILFDGVEVGQGSKLRRVIVEEGVRIPPGTKIGFGGDAREFTTSPGGVVVVSASYRFPTPEKRGRRPAHTPAKKADKPRASRGNEQTARREKDKAVAGTSLQ